jgi:hypothetical protein
MIPIMTIGLFDFWIDFRRFFRRDQTTTWYLLLFFKNGGFSWR